MQAIIDSSRTIVVDEAQRYAAEGKAVFPVNPGTKAPYVRGGFKTATTDRHQIARWWRAHPDALIGLPTGDGLAVVDVDTRHGGTVDPSWPETLTARTRSGGFHLYYWTAEPIGCSVSKVAQGVDIRGEGGYVIVPPSLGWKWIDQRELAELPQSIRDAVTQPRTSEDRRGRGFSLQERVSEGGRNDYLARAAGYALYCGIPVAELADWLHDHNREVCDPPLPAREVETIARGIARREETKVR